MQISKLLVVLESENQTELDWGGDSKRLWIKRCGAYCTSCLLPGRLRSSAGRFAALGCDSAVPAPPFGAFSRVLLALGPPRFFPACFLFGRAALV